jgi:hypothetical protein
VGRRDGEGGGALRAGNLRASLVPSLPLRANRSPSGREPRSYRTLLRHGALRRWIHRLATEAPRIPRHGRASQSLRTRHDRAENSPDGSGAHLDQSATVAFVVAHARHREFRGVPGCHRLPRPHSGGKPMAGLHACHWVVRPTPRDSGPRPCRTSIELIPYSGETRLAGFLLQMMTSDEAHRNCSPEGVFQPSSWRLSNSLTSPGFPLPRVAFMTAPTRKPIAVAFPAR